VGLDGSSFEIDLLDLVTDHSNVFSLAETCRIPLYFLRLAPAEH